MSTEWDMTAVAPEKVSIEYIARRPRFSRLIVVGTAVLVVTVFVAFFGLQRSFEVGRLAVPPKYDDVSYLLAAQVLLHAAQHQSWLETLRQLIDQHAPLSTFLAVLGFLAVPQGWAGPYIANCLVLGGFLAGCAVLLRPLPTPAIIGVIAAIGAIPVASVSITEFRPDFAWGFLSGLAAATLLRRRLFQFSWKRLLLIGLLCGLALVSKPSTGPLTAVILATAFVGSVLLYVLAGDRAAIRTRFRAIARVAALIGLGAAIVAGPVYAMIWRDVYAYILLALVEYHDQNATPGDFLFQLLFYSRGPAGRTMLGQALWVLPLFWLAALAYSAIYKRDLLPRLLCYLAVILVAYAILTYNDHKSLYVGGVFYGTLIASSCAVAGELWRIAANSQRLTGLRIATARLICVAGIALLVGANALHHPVLLFMTPPEMRKDLMEATAQIWSVLKDHVASRGKELATPKTYNVMVLSPEPVADATLSLLAVSQDVPLQAHGTYYVRTIDELVLQIKNVDYAVVTNSDPSHNLYGPRLGDAFMKVMDDRQDFKRIMSYSRLVGGTVKVYERRP